MVKITICGACGRMGSRIFNLAVQDKETEIVGLVESKTHPMVGKRIENKYEVIDNLEKVIDNTDVVIEFTIPEATIKHLGITKNRKKSIVIGTTGFKNKALEIIKKNNNVIPIVMSPNMSKGMNLIFKLVDKTAEVLSDYDIEIIEAHHNKKKDAPSGTAKKIAEVIAKKLNRDLAKDAVYGREGMIGSRKPDEIGIFAIRGGNIVGEHSVLFAGQDERIELIHRISSRDTFAKGALIAAKWLFNKKPGLYDMQDVLGLK